MKVYVLFFIMTIVLKVWAQPRKQLFISNDDHTDYMWTGNEEQYARAFVKMLDYYIAKADQTDSLASPYQSRFNCDGTYWLWEYERQKSPTEFQKLVEKIKSGHISVPYNALVSCYGAAPAEGILRGMYYAGYLERKYGIKLDQAVAMENQTLPLGLSSLWAGCGVKYSWKGVCNCASKISDLKKRNKEIFWYKGLDESKILMKWYSLPHDNKGLGGYAEARNPSLTVDQLTAFCGSSQYPYHIAGAFGYGWDDLQTTTDTFTIIASQKTTAERQVIVSNQSDFFKAFESAYGKVIPDESLSYGNEWDVYSASMAEVSANIKRAVEKLRSAEAMAAIVSVKKNNFAANLGDMRKKAWMALGLYYEHDWTADGPIKREARAAWQRKMEQQLTSYVDSLYVMAGRALGDQIPNKSKVRRFYAFNPLGWTRTDVCDFPYEGSTNVKVMDIATRKEVPSQLIINKGKKHLRILAMDVPSIGYKIYELIQGTPKASHVSGRVTNNVLENKFYKITITNQGVMTGFVDKLNGNRQLVAEVNGKFMNDLGSGFDNSGNLSVENDGVVSTTIVCRGKTPLNHTSSVTLYKDIPRVDIHNEINENFSDVQSWSFSYNIPNAEVLHEETGAVLTAKLSAEGGHYATMNARFDWLTLNHFADISNGQFGFTLSNADCSFMKVGNSALSTLDTRTPQISVLAGGQVDGKGLGIPDQGGDSIFTQRFAIRTHTEGSASDAMRFSLEHQNPILAGEVTAGDPLLPGDKYSFLTLTAPAVLWSLKPAEEGNEKGLVVRIWNFGDNEMAITLSTEKHIISAYHASHVETDTHVAKVVDGNLKETIGKHQLKTFRILLESTK